MSHIVRRSVTTPKTVPALSSLVAKVETGSILDEANNKDYIPDLPKECLNKTYCPRTLNHPEDYDDIVKCHEAEIRASLIMSLASMECETEGGENEEFKLCQSVREPIIPGSTLKDVDGIPRLLVIPKNMTLMIRGCAAEEGLQQCANDYATVEIQEPMQYTKKCMQKNYYIATPVYSSKDGESKLIEKTLSWPICCECIIKPIKN